MSSYYSRERDCLEDIQAWIDANEVKEEFERVSSDVLLDAIRTKITRVLDVGGAPIARKSRGFIGYS